VGTAMQEWNKNLDKFILYDTTTIVQTSMDIDGLVEEIEEFARDRGVVTNGKIGGMVDSFIDSGSGKGDEQSKQNNLAATTIETIKTNKTLQSKDTVTLYISRLADNKKVLDYIAGDKTMFEREPLEKLASDGELMCFRHDGFWQCMDTLRDKTRLEKLWESGKAPWKVWED
jgi:hypothetical protein